MKRLITALLAALALCSGAAAQQPITMPANTLYGRLGVSPGPGQAIPFATVAPLLGSVVGPGPTVVGNVPVWSNVLGTALGAGSPPGNFPSSVQTVNYTLAPTDCGTTVQLGTGSTGQLALTIPAISGFTLPCEIEVENGDTTRGKTFSGAGLPSNAPLLLMPQQTIKFKILSGAWAVTKFPGRWKIAPSTTITLNTDFTNGSDTNDGMATTTGALKTVEACLGLIANYFDFNGTTAPSKAKCLMASASTDTTGVHQAFHAFVGCNGGACVTLDGNGGSLTAAVQFYFGTVIQIRNVTLSNASGNCLEAQWGAKIYILDAVTFGACVGGSHMNLQNGASHIELDNSYTVSGSAAFHINAGDGASVRAAASQTVTISAPLTVTDWLIIASPAYANIQSQTFNLGGNAVTGAKGLIELNGAVVQSNATLAVTNVVNGTGNACRLTLAATSSLAEGQKIIVAAIAGATGCNTASPPTGSTTHIVDGTHIELTGTTFGGSYTSGGTVQMGLPGTADPTVTLGGQLL